MKRRKPRRDTASEGAYICPECGEQIVIPVDVLAGDRQEFVEDCPVCCHPNLIRIELEDGGDARVWADAE